MKSFKLLLISAIIGITMSCGIHRVVQSSWSCPNEGQATTLYLYASFDAALPKAGYLKVTFPAALTHNFATANAWALGATLKPPTTYTITGTVSGSLPTKYVTFSADLSANTAYGIALGIASSAATAGVYAPIGL